MLKIDGVAVSSAPVIAAALEDIRPLEFSNWEASTFFCGHIDCWTPVILFWTSLLYLLPGIAASWTFRWPCQLKALSGSLSVVLMTCVEGLNPWHFDHSSSCTWLRSSKAELNVIAKNIGGLTSVVLCQKEELQQQVFCVGSLDFTNSLAFVENWDPWMSLKLYFVLYWLCSKSKRGIWKCEIHFESWISYPLIKRFFNECAHLFWLQETKHPTMRASVHHSGGRLWLALVQLYNTMVASSWF